jgi:hypothetical protein
LKLESEDKKKDELRVKNNDTEELELLPDNMFAMLADDESKAGWTENPGASNQE